jgi:hypothetical protein
VPLSFTSGTVPVTDVACCGLVPQVIIGSRSSTSMLISSSNAAPASEARVRQFASARSQISPFGAKSRPAR